MPVNLLPTVHTANRHAHFIPDKTTEKQIIVLQQNVQTDAGVVRGYTDIQTIKAIQTRPN